MKYYKETTLKDGRTCIIRNGVREDGQAVFDVFNLTHAQTDWLLSYPEENSKNVEQEGDFLQSLTDGESGIEVIAEIDGKIVGTAGIDAIGEKYKVRHRAEFGIGVDKNYWRLGIGRALTEACVECARKAGYEQLELDVVADNASAISLYKSFGFIEYGRNPKGFRSRVSGWQELVLMRLELGE